MALPQISAPEFSAVIPSTSQEIKFRPFLVKEEKILLMALEGNDTNEMINAVINILDSCILSEVTTDLSLFDVEYLFLKLRGKSVGEKVQLKVKHSEGVECEHLNEIEIDLDKVEVQGEIKDGKIMLNDNIGVKLRYPSITDAIKFAGKTDDASVIFDLIINCIEYVYDNENVYQPDSEQEMREWIESLSQDQFVKMAEFFDEMPRLKHKATWTCTKCGTEDSLEIEGLQNFFA